MGSVLCSACQLVGNSMKASPSLAYQLLCKILWGEKNQNSIDVGHIKPVSLILSNYEVRRMAEGPAQDTGILEACASRCETLQGQGMGLLLSGQVIPPTLRGERDVCGGCGGSYL